MLTVFGKRFTYFKTNIFKKHLLFIVCGLYTYIVKKETSFPNKKSMEELLCHLI